MPRRHMTTARTILRVTLAAVVLWSLAVGGSLWWNVERQKAVTWQLALNTARDSFKKDQAYRQWASSHGGVYVRPTEKTPPSPWMAHLPDRDLLTTDGQQLTLMNPAYMLREMMQDFSDFYGIRGRIVGIVYLNPNNQADAWEADAIRQFTERGLDEKIEYSEIDAQPYVRLMRPMIMQESCQKCHGHLGFPNGSVRGGVSVSVPLAPYLSVERHAIGAMQLTHGLVWFLGLTGISIVGHRTARRLDEQTRIAEENTLAAQVFANALDASLITDASGIIVRVNPAFCQLTGYDSGEAVGHKPNILRSEHHDDQFYAELWQTLLREGSWQGEIMNRRKDGSVFVARESIVSVPDDVGKIKYFIASFSDMTQEEEARRHIHYLAHFDALTSLPNRTLFHDRLRHALFLAEREQRQIALLFMDLDGFKAVNDTLGHRAGDDLLLEVAERLRLVARSSDTIARLGGDEFIAILEGITQKDDAVLIAERILQSLAAPVQLGDQSVVVGVSIGISLYPDDGDNTEDLLKHADIAMYQAKGAGKGRYCFYNSNMSHSQARHLELNSRFRESLDAGAFEVYYQPKVNAATRTLAGFEALVRWPHPTLGLVSPLEFIPLAEQLRLITRLDLLVLDHACRVGRMMLDQGKDVVMAVNLSSYDLAEPNLPSLIGQSLRRHSFPAANLELEITESVAMEIGQGHFDMLNALCRMGLSLAIDDFGTGYSSFSYLKRLPASSLKIDRAFVRDIVADRRDRALVATMVDIAHTLDLTAVAEGVEDEEQLALLQSYGCDIIQGYLFSPPLAEAKALDFPAYLPPQRGE